MEYETNKVSVVMRITGATVDVMGLASSLASLHGQVEIRPPTVPADALPEAWWAIEVVNRSQESTEMSIAEVLDRLTPMLAAIQDVANDPRFQIELDCTVEIEEERPVMEVSAQTLMRLAGLRAALGFEVHDYRE